MISRKCPLKPTFCWERQNVKMVKKNEKCQKCENLFCFNSKDMMTWVWIKTCSPKCFEHLIILKNLLLVNLPLLRPREKMRFFDQIFTFSQNFCMLGQQVLPKIVSWKERHNILLHKPNFGFFISLMIMKMFCFENKSHEGWIFK